MVSWRAGSRGWKWEKMEEKGEEKEAEGGENKREDDEDDGRPN